MLNIKDLHVSVDDKAILKGIDLTVKPGDPIQNSINSPMPSSAKNAIINCVSSPPTPCCPCWS